MRYKRIYAEQDNFVAKMLEIPRPCPVCKHEVSLTVEREHEDPRPDMPESEWECFCPECNTHLEYALYAFSPPQFIVKEGTSVHFDPKEKKKS